MASERVEMEVLDEGVEDSGEVNACCSGGVNSARQ
jgi:putative radical SAM-modified peptide